MRASVLLGLVGSCLGFGLVPLACGDSFDSPTGGDPSSSSATSGAGASGGGGSASGGGGHGASGGNEGGAGAAGGGGSGGSGGGTASAGGGGAGGVGGNGSGGGSGGSGGANPGCLPGDDCGPGKYCKADNCTDGTCEFKPSGIPPTNEALVCGCDGVTYWNATIAAQKGASVATSGACAGGMQTPCGPGAPCLDGLVCNKQVPNATQCDPGTATGFCWGIPTQCPLNGAQARACSNKLCETTCALAASQNPWFDDGLCP